MSITCRVSFTDGANVTHTVTVSASSLYEAAVLGIAEFKRSGFAFGGIGPTTHIRIAVEPPAITHELSVGKLQAWLNSNGTNPREQAKKVTLRHKTALLKRLERLEQVRTVENRTSVEFQMGYLKKLPQEYTGERHVVTVGRATDGKYRWEERRGAPPASEDSPTSPTTPGSTW